MKKTIIVSTITVVMLSLIVSYYIFYYSFETSSYFMASRSNVKMQEAYWGPYYRIIYGLNKDKEAVYLIHIKGEKDPYLVYEKEGTSKDKALEIASQNGYRNIEKIFLLLNKTGPRENSKETLLRDLTWRLYYDVSKGSYVEVDFETGGFKYLETK